MEKDIAEDDHERGRGSRDDRARLRGGHHRTRLLRHDGEHLAGKSGQEQVPRDRQDPETQQGEDGVDADDVEADELVDGLARDEMALVQVVADGQRRDEVGQHEDQPQIHSVHVVTSF